MTSSRKRQRTLYEFTSSSSPARPSRQGKASQKCPSSEEYDSDPGRIQFEHGDNQRSSPPHKSFCTQEARSSSVISICSSLDSLSAESASAPIKPPFISKKSNRAVVISDESDPQPARKKRKLVKGKRLKLPSIDTGEVEDIDLLEEVDEDMILNSRLRDRSKKSAYARNLERLQRRRRGEMSPSENEGEDDADSSAASSASKSEYFEGAQPTCSVQEEEQHGDEGSLRDEDDNGFIVEDNSGESMPELPTMFSMSTFQDLSHHFKVICQLFVHLAIQESHTRRSFIRNALKKNYFSVPLTTARRKLSSMKDSMIASSVWKSDFKKLLETFPVFRLEHLDFAIPVCDACHLGNRVATLRGLLSGHEYDSLTYEPRQVIGEPGDEEAAAADWSLGRFCAARAQVFHTFTHWEHILYHTLRTEVNRLKQSIQPKSKNGRVFLPATNGPPPPDDLSDADGMMEWLDGRGIINAQWVKMKDMMERAHNLEGKGKGTEDDIQLG